MRIFNFTRGGKALAPLMMAACFVVTFAPQAAWSQKPIPPRQGVARDLTLRNALAPCCEIVAADMTKVVRTPGSASSRVVTARDRTTGKTFRIRVDDAKSSTGRKATVTGLKVPEIPAGGSTRKYRPGQTVYRDEKSKFVVVTSFPINATREDNIGATSRKMRTTLTVSDNGRIDGSTRTWTAEALRGFTGAVEVGLTDIAGNVLYRMPTKSYGVDPTTKPGGKSDRTVPWTVQVPADALNEVAAVVIFHHHDPKNRFPGAVRWIQQNWECIVEIYQMYTDVTGEEDSEQEFVPVEEGQDLEEAKDLLKACENLFN